MKQEIKAQGRSLVCAGLCGAWLALGLGRFGSPVIFPDRLFGAYLLMTLAFIVGMANWKWPKSAPGWIITLPVVWLGWQLLAALRSIDPVLTGRTVIHFASLAIAFYFGLAILSNLQDLYFLWLFYFLALIVVIGLGLDQHFAGLEETRRYFQIYELPKYPNGRPPEVLQRLASNRVYSTLVYPNTFAAVLIFGLPLLLTKLYFVAHATRPARLFLVSLFGLAGALCLFWSGSKAGWLIAVTMIVIALLQLEFSRRIKIIMVVVICLLGMTGFLWRYSSYLQRGATSATARLDYWRAAVTGFAEHPFLGAGPGTFKHTYKRLKPPQAEMAQLTHNDYLEQACDSGLPGFLALSVFVFGSVALLYRKGVADPMRFAVWLSLFGVSLHGFVEFNLYVPAVAWPEFLFFGWLWGQSAENGGVRTKSTGLKPSP